MYFFPNGNEKSKIELSPSSKGKTAPPPPPPPEFPSLNLSF